ncbi:MAG TPA: PrsW family glutamic-type intramembrane protease [Ktedonobacteraceae bacterium]|nr:PrsW family glutamic-type intramembrane protease [Ktedonobacteraceae bacterium]
MNQHYGVLRVVRVRPPANAAANLQNKYPTGWLPEERLVHLLTRRETTIGRALSNDIILMDPTVSREHARLVLDEQGWHVVNLTEQNIVRVNGRPVPGGGNLALQPQDILVLGSTMLQLLAPHRDVSAADEPTQRLSSPQHQSTLSHGTVVEWGRPPSQARLDGQNPSLAPSPQGSVPSQVQPWQPQQAPAARQGMPAFAFPLPVQSEPELVAQPWDDGEEDVLGPGVTMQFAIPQRMSVRMRWLIAGVGIAILTISAIITIVLNSLIGLSALAQNGLPSVLAALTVPLIPAIGIMLLVNFIDRYEREPWFLRLAAFLWGAIIAIPPSLLIEQNGDAIMQNVLGPDASNLVRAVFQGLNAGIPEETVKGLGLLLLFLVLRDQFDNVTDGIVYGALIGAGFAMVENFVYFATNSKNFLLFLIVGRVVLGWLSHSTFTVCFGAALGYVRHTRVRWRQIVVPLVGYLCAVGLHSVFDFIDFYASALVLASPNNPSVTLFSLVAIIGDYIPPFIAQMVILYFLIKSLTHEAAVIREFLAPEVSNGVVRVDEYALLQNSFQRTKKERQVLFRYGIKQWLLVKALYQTEIGLAFRKWHVSMGDKPKFGYRRQPEDVYRQLIGRLRQQVMAGEKR